MKNRILAVLLASTLSVLAVSCSNTNETSAPTTAQNETTTIVETTEADVTTVDVTDTVTETEADETTAPAEEKPSQDRQGNDIVIPDEIENIASLAGSITEILVDLGHGDNIVAIDLYSSGFDGVASDTPAIDMMSPDIETLLSLDLDIVFASNISDAGSEDSVFQQLIDAGITVAYIPTANSLEDIRLDIEFIGLAVGATAETEALLRNFDTQLDELATIGSSIPEAEKQSVLFEISALPAIYSTGSGSFLNEVIELIGATNLLADESGWVPVTEESAIALNPDVILTNVNYIEDPVGEIMGRPGWEAITAIENEAVYPIDNSASSLPNHNVINAAWEIARAVYPAYYN